MPANLFLWLRATVLLCSVVYAFVCGCVRLKFARLEREGFCKDVFLALLCHDKRVSLCHDKRVSAWCDRCGGVSHPSCVLDEKPSLSWHCIAWDGEGEQRALTSCQGLEPDHVVGVFPVWPQASRSHAA